MGGPYVPSGHSPPFEVVDELHHGAWLIITAALGLVISLVCFLIRLYVRLMLIPPFARDDWVLLGATALAVVQSSLVFYACSRGFGTSITLLIDGRLNQIQALIATSDVFALIIIYLSKCCVVAIYLRLTPQKPHNRASWATLALCTAWVIPAIFIVLINCELNTPWRGDGGQCKNLFRRWQFIATVDVITELLLFILAIVLLKGLFMSVRRKLGIGFAFIFRFPLIIFSLIHIFSLNDALKNKDTTLASIRPAVWMQVELHYALVACSVFCLRPFMAAVSTNYGTAGDSTLESSASRSRGTKGSSKDGSGSGTGSGSNSASATRSRSHSRVQRKRAGTASRFMPHLGVDLNLKTSGSGLGSGSGSGSGLGIPSSSKDVLCRDGNPHAHAHGSPRKKHPVMSGGCPKPGSATDTSRTPIRRSMFPLSAPLNQSIPKPEKGKRHNTRSGEGNVFPTDSDLIELVPRPHVRHEGRGDDRSDGEDPDRMVIHKEVRYSIQYEDDEEVEARQ
ncbi:hypothetical protein PENARI_c013G10508 [Penicillium arizonense]|uniref:Rhodopsin domain-containing protein n=1 Tax=Penicillium arizonense TaxID=1835702 RepID=A0A1F5LDV7_PENAI|nr:hypothetical protein PENARI_c013G10508 [Penicillium arizonense]OGE51335.1 hypothetical protein PENARI_c013G10508 [Penicillium arizonense]